MMVTKRQAGNTKYIFRMSGHRTKTKKHVKPRQILYMPVPVPNHYVQIPEGKKTL